MFVLTSVGEWVVNTATEICVRYNKPKTKQFMGYVILQKANIDDNVRSMINVMERSKNTMIKPLMFHFVCEIVDVDALPLDKLIQTLKEKFKSELNKNNKKRVIDKMRKRKVPRLEIIFSLETKSESTKPIYHHIHIMLIVDAGHNEFGSKELPIMFNKALNRVDGLEKIIIENDFDMQKHDGQTMNHGFLKFRDRNSIILGDDATFVDIRCHNLKEEFNDAVIRASYLCKDTQKKHLPERFKKQSFGVTRKQRKSLSEVT